MKSRLLVFFIFSFISFSTLAQSGVITASIKVYGNCGMCKKRIETALDHKGIKKAVWDSKTKELQVVYSSAKISEQKIHELIALAGHDTDLVKAKEEKYASLPFCCLYRDHDHKMGNH
jgi:periplasmic mercuric ion binding protein